ncbi:MAG: EAL domain-containing response regulator, partial [Hyphomicrobiales bacterium]|nr:EAL domain-containing response regulator [Hyphomicrobiales bacterium]
MESVLVVDDDPLACEVAESFFRKIGASKISVAHNGQDALKIVEQRSELIDLILLDLKMPVMDGVQFLRRLHERGHQGVIVIVSGEGAAISALAIDLAEKHGLNVVGSLPKPFDPIRLEALISKPNMFAGPVRDRESHAITVSEFREALERQQIIAHYQPQIDVSTDAIAGVEALARWMHPEKGLIPPVSFVPLAEDNGLMPLLTHLMIKNVIGAFETLDQVSPDLTVSINLGAAILSDTEFPDDMALMVDRCALDRKRFILELTESKLVQDSTDSLEVLARLDLAGFELSLDDFGTQFS